MNLIDQKKFSESFYSEIKCLIAQHTVKIAPMFMDFEEATDLIVGEAAVAVRVRTNDARRWSNAENEFTLRSRTQHNRKNEIDKIAQGYTNLFFYGFANENGTRINRWFLFDCEIMRKVLSCPKSMGVECVDISNRGSGDNTAFRAYDIKSFNEKAPDFIIDTNAENLKHLIKKDPLSVDIHPDLFDGLFH
jgi:hypothetical protein